MTRPGFRSGLRSGMEGDAVVREGIDFSGNYPSAQQLIAAGRDFVIRYARSFSYPKSITAEEAAYWKTNRIDVAIVEESGANRALQGRDAGRQDANNAANQIASIGGPRDGVIYLAVDFDATAGEIAGPVREYISGGVDALGTNRIGVYGSYAVVKYALDNALCRYGWQTYAWSAGLLDPRAHLYQYRNAQTLGGVTVDFCRAYADDFGQWARPAAEEADFEVVALSKEELTALIDQRMLGSQAYFWRLSNTTTGRMRFADGQTSNDSLVPMLVGRLNAAFNDANAIKAGITQTLTAVGLQADDERNILSALAVLPTGGMTDEQVAQLAAALNISSEQIAAAVRADLGAALTAPPSA